jgi:hypothetical protein
MYPPGFDRTVVAGTVSGSFCRSSGTERDDLRHATGVMIARRIRRDGGGLEPDHPLVFVTQPGDLGGGRSPLGAPLGCCIAASF